MIATLLCGVPTSHGAIFREEKHENWMKTEQVPQDVAW